MIKSATWICNIKHFIALLGPQSNFYIRLQRNRDFLDYYEALLRNIDDIYLH